MRSGGTLLTQVSSALRPHGDRELEIVDFGLRGSPGRILDLIWEVLAQLPARQPGGPRSSL